MQAVRRKNKTKKIWATQQPKTKKLNKGHFNVQGWVEILMIIRISDPKKHLLKNMQHIAHMSL